MPVHSELPPTPDKRHEFESFIPEGAVQLERLSEEPILGPRPDLVWADRALFNPTAIKLADGRIMLFPRGIGNKPLETNPLDYKSFMGRAVSLDGIHFTLDPQPVISPDTHYDSGAVEDPRITVFDDPGDPYHGKALVTYVAIPVPAWTPDKLSPTALAVATNDDLTEFKKLGLISPHPDRWDDRDTVLFPQKIGGKYTMLHRPQKLQQGDFCGPLSTEENKVKSTIWISQSDSLTGEWPEGQSIQGLEPREKWESLKIGAGAPPIKTDAGWLLIYHGVQKPNFPEQCPIYRAGAALLDLEDPTQVIGRLNHPILEPSRGWEIEGDVDNVVFPEGAVIHDGQLFIYYGGADDKIGVAGIDANKLITALVQSGK